MVAAQHKLSRRALLAGACAGAALPFSRHPELASGSSWSPVAEAEDWALKRVQGDGGAGDERWEKALALYARAEAEVEALVHVDDDSAYDRALGRHNAALARLLRTPAPDVGAVAGKLELILRHQVFELRFGEASLAALGRDLRRFAAAGATGVAGA